MQLSLPFRRPPPLPVAARPATLPRASTPGGWTAREEAIMGTAIRVELWCASRSHADAAIDAVMAEMHRIDDTYSPHKPESELSRVNERAHETPVTVGKEMVELLEQAARFSALSDGAFDITYASVGHLYDYRRGVQPDAQAAERARRAIGWRHVQVDAHAATVSFDRPGVRIDFGGFAKGHAVNRGIDILRRHGIEHAIVTAGGDSRVLGDRLGRPWSIAIRHPRQPGEVIAVLPLEDTAISTSGDYERFFERAGVRHHHLIDPATGRSPQGIHSVTILAPDGLTSEALSKSVFVLGVERGLALVESVPGSDAVVVDASGDLHYSSGLQRR